METIYTRQLADRRLPSGSNPIIIDPENIEQTIAVLKSILEKSDTIEIFDCPSLNNLVGKIIPVNDHVNRTGINPLVGRQKISTVEFIDLTQLYVNKPDGVTTYCCGNHPIPDGIPHPTMFLSTISILARALDYKEIHAYVVC